jgi:hypothetical protein
MTPKERAEMQVLRLRGCAASLRMTPKKEERQSKSLGFAQDDNQREVREKAGPSTPQSDETALLRSG